MHRFEHHFIWAALVTPALISSVCAQPAKVVIPQTDCLGDPLPYGAVARLGTVRFKAHAKTAAVSPDGKWIASTAGDKFVEQWDAKSGKLVRRFEVNVWPHNICALAWSPDSKTLVSAGTSISVWDVETGVERLRISEAKHETFCSLAISPDGKTLATGSHGHVTVDGPQKSSVCIWDAVNGKRSRLLSTHDNAVEGVSFSPDGKMLATASRDHSLILWDVESGKATHHLGDKSQPMSRVVFAPNGKTLASGNWTGEVAIWDADRKTILHRIAAQNHPIDSLDYSPDSKQLVVGGTRPTVWSVDEGKRRVRIELDHAAWHGAFGRDGKTLVVSGGDSAIHLWDLEAGKEVFGGRGHGYDPLTLSLSPDSRTAATAGFDGVYVWDLASGQKKHHLQTADLEGFWCATFSPDGQTVASGGREIRLWDVSTGKQFQQWKTDEYFTFSLVYSPDGSTLYSGGYFLIQVWDSKKGKAIRQFGKRPPLDEIEPGRVAPLRELMLSPDGKIVFADRFWNTQTGGEMFQNQFAKSTSRCLFSAGGKSLITLKSPIHNSAETLVVWDLATGRMQQTYQKEGFHIHAFAQSPQGKYFAVAGEDGSLRLWEAATGKELHTFQGGGSILAFTADARYLVSSSSHCDFLVWDVSGWVKE